MVEHVRLLSRYSMDLERILNKMVNGVGTNLARILSGSSTDLEADPLVHSTQSLRPHRARPFLPISLFLLSRLLSIPPPSLFLFSLSLSISTSPCCCEFVLRELVRISLVLRGVGSARNHFSNKQMRVPQHSKNAHPVSLFAHSVCD